jgi:hypothetical protein
MPQLMPQPLRREAHCNHQALKRSRVEVNGCAQDPQARTSKAVAEFGFAAEVSLEDWLSRTVGWYSGHEA